MTKQDQTDCNFLLDNARAGKSLALSSFLHLDQPVGLWNYIRIANDIVRQTTGDILDWGATDKCHIFCNNRVCE